MIAGPAAWRSLNRKRRGPEFKRETACGRWPTVLPRGSCGCDAQRPDMTRLTREAGAPGPARDGPRDHAPGRRDRRLTGHWPPEPSRPAGGCTSSGVPTTRAMVDRRRPGEIPGLRRIMLRRRASRAEITQPVRPQRRAILRGAALPARKCTSRVDSRRRPSGLAVRSATRWGEAVVTAVDSP